MDFVFVPGVPVVVVPIIVPRYVRYLSKSASLASLEFSGPSAASWALSVSSSKTSPWALVGATVGDLSGASMGDLVSVFDKAAVSVSGSDVVGINVSDFYTTRAGMAV